MILSPEHFQRYLDNVKVWLEGRKGSALGEKRKHVSWLSGDLNKRMCRMEEALNCLSRVFVSPLRFSLLGDPALFGPSYFSGFTAENE